MDNRLLEFVDVFELPSTTWEVIQESKEDSVVDGVNILARVAGPAFLVNGSSANGRFYSEKLWENVITRNKERLQKGQALGTIGHDQPLDDQALLEGKPSHRVSKIWIDKKNNIGMMELLVLGTPAGKVLNTYLRSGVEFPVSSRAFGEYKGKTPQGDDIIDEETFQFETFDFVRTPGVAKAIPKLVESVMQKDSEKPNSILETENMDTKMYEALTQEKLQVEANLNTALDKNKILEMQAEKAGAELATAKEASVKVSEELASVQEALAQANEKLAAFEELGSLEDITKALELGGSIGEALKDLGSLEELSAMKEEVGEYHKLGTGKEISEILDIVGKYREIGTIEEIQEAFEGVQKLVTGLKEAKEQSEAQEFAKTSGVDESVASKLLKTMNRDEASKLVESLKSSNSAYDTYRKTEKSESKAEGKKSSVVNESLSSRLYRRV